MSKDRKKGGKKGRVGKKGLGKKKKWRSEEEEVIRKRKTSVRKMKRKEKE